MPADLPDTGPGRNRAAVVQHSNITGSREVSKLLAIPVTAHSPALLGAPPVLPSGAV